MQKINYWTFLTLTAVLLTGLQTIAQDVTPVKPPDYAPGLTPAYVRSWEAMSPQTDPALLITGSTKAVRQTTQYVDGLGRPLQTVIKSGATATNDIAKDLVVPVVYDEFGREVRKYLPFAATDNSGTFKLNPFTQQAAFYLTQLPNQGEAFFYSKTEFETSPLNRPLRTYAPGNSWVGGGRGTTISYETNTVEDQVHIWKVADHAGGWGSYNGTLLYAPNELFKTSSVDEDYKQVIEFKDKEGQVILKKVQEISTRDLNDGYGPGHTGWLCTYYIYDDLNQLRGVIQPQGVRLLEANGWNMTALSNAILEEQCFRYEYDGRGRMIRKKVPGAGEVYMIYDVRDRLVYTQDANLRLTGQWLCNLYDALNRTIATALVSYNGGFTELTELVATQTAGATNIGVPVPPDLIIHGKLSGKIIASHSIIFEGEFETIRHNPFEAGIATPTTGAISPLLNNILVSRNPLPQISGVDILTNTFYDNYDWRHDYNDPLTATRNNSLDAHLLAPGGTYYAETPVQSAHLIGLVTGTRTKVLGTGDQYLFSASFYNEKGRVIQTQSTNFTKGIDISSIQYSFNGNPLLTIQQQENRVPNPEIITTCTRLSYDDMWRISGISKKVSHPQINGGAFSADKITSNSFYDQLGLLTLKTIGRKSTGDFSTIPLENIKYDYNIRGWLLGANRDYINHTTNAYLASDHFGYELAYDKRTSIIDNNVTNTFAKAQFNGNITGTIWRSFGDGEKRKYDYDYDPANRLLKGDFTQLTGANAANFDFSIGGDPATGGVMKYDANGNIKEMWQKGLKIDVSNWIDQLSYNYFEHSNRLKNVIDHQNDPGTKLGDFRTSLLHPENATKNAATIDYLYDVNGNLTKDLNKDIAGNGIVYNHLNLPMQIPVLTSGGATKGTITYTYDATGKKLKKEVAECGHLPKTTLYLGGSVYENNALQFLPQEEGRIRFVTEPAPASPHLEYDYFLKDHLGNVRMVLTEEQKTTRYFATMEAANRTNETQLFGNISETVVNRSVVPGGYPAPENSNPPNDYLSRVNGTLAYGTGPSLLLKVVAGDELSLGVNYFYKDHSGTIDNLPHNGRNVATAYSFIKSLQVLPDALKASVPGNDAQLWGDLITGVVNAYVSNTNTSYSPPDKPKASLNWIFMDEQFGGDGIAQCGTVPVNGSEEIRTLASALIPINKNGYLYIYVSNETQNWDVFFDNLSVEHWAGPLIEETHYYPFGLAMAGISTKALGKLTNRIKFQGQEMASQEFSDGSGLDMYEFKWRMDDPQTGRFWQVDPLADKYVHNSTYAFSENKVTRHVELEGLEAEDVMGQISNGIWKSAGISRSSDPIEFTQNAVKETLKPRFWIEAYVEAGQIAMPMLLTSIGTGGVGSSALLEAELASLRLRNLSTEYVVSASRSVTGEAFLGGAATLEDGVMDMAIYMKNSAGNYRALPGTTTGTDVFNGMYNSFKENGGYIRVIRGSWTADDNLAAFNKAISRGLTPEQAALETFTGRQAASKGYTNLKVTGTPGADGSYPKVNVEFTRPQRDPWSPPYIYVPGAPDANGH